MNKFLLPILLIIICHLSNAQTVIFHEEFNNCIRKLAIDEDNDVLWMGTGLSDGGNLIMRDGNGNRTDLSDLTANINFQSISALFMDESTLFVGGYGGVAIIDPEDEVFIQYTNDNSDLSYSNELNTLVFDYNSELLYAGNIATSTDILSEDGWTKDNSLKKITASVFDYENDCLWLANTSGDLIKIKDDIRTVYNIANSAIPNLPYIDMTIDLEGNIYLLVSQNGFVHFDGNTATHYTPDNSDLFGGELRSIDVDYNGKVWFGHNGGITSFKNGNFATYPLEGELGFFPTVQDIVVDNDNHLWLGSCSGLIEFYLDVTSITTERSNALSINPNPNNGNFTFEAADNGELEIIDQFGKVIYKADIKKGGNPLHMVSPSGQYFYNFITEVQSHTGKFIIH